VKWFPLSACCLAWIFRCIADEKLWLQQSEIFLSHNAHPGHGHVLLIIYVDATALHKGWEANELRGA
jgi:hypothetical protein